MPSRQEARNQPTDLDGEGVADLLGSSLETESLAGKAVDQEKGAPDGSGSMKGVKGWLLVYLIGSIPLLMVYSMGLSGWFFDYPFVLMLAIFAVLAIPLLLVLLKSPTAPRWNIFTLWTIVVLMTLRSISVFVFPMASEGQPPMSSEELPGVLAILSGIVAFTVGWAIVWTKYFRASVRVKNTFG